MFWGALGYGRRTSLVALFGDPESKKSGVNAKVVRQVYEEQLPNILHEDSYFVQHNALVHKALLVRTWMVEFANSRNVTVIDWPSYSPDLNPIENG